MISLPQNLPEEVTNYCSDCKTNEQVMDKLENNLPFLITFFKSANNDEKWCRQCPHMVERLTKFLDVESIHSGLTLDQAREVNQVAKDVF